MSTVPDELSPNLGRTGDVRFISLGSLLRPIGHGFLDLLYPPRCLDCGARVESPRLPLCPRCLHSLERAPVMGVEAQLDRLPNGHGAIDRAFALWMFDKESPLQALQHAFKYNNRPWYGVPLGRLVGDAFKRAHPDASPDGVVPVPLHRTRRLERGYNQSRLLATGIADVLDCSLRATLLRRPHPTRSQTNLSREERWQNVRDAFHAENEAQGGRWLLVDDVLTTGSTAVASAQSLRDAGAGGVSLATLAFARP